jgi:hypothetical protein
MKEPPKRAHRVGALYDPRQRSWPERADYNFRAGGHELRLFLRNATGAEVEAVREGRIGFGLLVELPELFLISRFRSPDSDRTVMSFDCSYQWHMVPEPDRTMPPAWEETSPETRALCTVLLVEASGGILLAIRDVRFSTEFTRALHQAIAAQAALPFDRAEHDRAVAEITRRYSTDQLWARCQHHCVGGE